MHTTSYRPKRTFEAMTVNNFDDLKRAMSHLSQIVAPGRLGDPFFGKDIHGETGFGLVIDGIKTNVAGWGGSVVFGHALDDRVIVGVLSHYDITGCLGDEIGGTTTPDASMPQYVTKPTDYIGNEWFRIEGNVNNSRVTMAMPIRGIGVIMRFGLMHGSGFVYDTILVPGAMLREVIGKDNKSVWMIESPSNTPMEVAVMNLPPGSILRANGDVQVNEKYDPFADGLREAAGVVATYVENRTYKKTSHLPVGAGDNVLDAENIDQEDVMASKVCADITTSLMARIKACAQKTFDEAPRPIGNATSKGE